MSSEPYRPSTFRLVRTLVILVGLTVWSLFVSGGSVFSPVGTPLVHALAVSWLVTMVVMPVGAVCSTWNALFALAGWERDGAIYDRVGVRVFRWALLHSPLAWINPNFHLRPNRDERERLVRETCNSEAVHWLTLIVSTGLAFVYFAHGHDAYGRAMLLVRIPWDVYPILLQRWNRARALRLVRRQPASAV